MKCLTCSTGVICFIILFLPVFFISSFSEAADSFIKVECQNGELVLQAKEAPLGQILEDIRNKCDLEITGLEDRENDSVTFSAAGETPEDVLKRLLRYLGINNYAFEFTEIKLARLSVLPKSGRTSSPSKPKEKPEQKEFASVVQVKTIVKGSQAEELELEKGDLIIEYDGVAVASPRQLVKEVKKRSPEESVEMVVVRDQQTMRYVLNGGFIGVRIGAIRLPKSEIDSYR
ncbi:PDZ domain-containing protein [Desulfococcaceae bacterium HSG8]|nr:PDZ domain-containing protein [Desulfococcaceae bacterium HSG8]